MSRYKIWNGTDDIYTPSGDKFTAAEWAARYPVVNVPGVKLVIADADYNGGFCMPLGDMKTVYRRAGVDITDGMTDEEALSAIEDFEDNPPDSGPSVEERTAAALEFLAMASLPDDE